MTKRMLVDATHEEETRVAVMDGNRLEEYDYESASRRTLKGNIYLGKVTRVEPSLQAAFIDYGGNRHGFLPFSDIHPDYYRIPVADREALLSEEEVQHSSEAENGENGVEEIGESADAVAEEEINVDRRRTERLRHAYKIQEVIKRRQILLVQVTKEERGNKGAALTTYISLAGRYCVLMPNTTRGGGISRKITNTNDRRRLKDLLDQLPLPEGMAIILRTAGVQRTKAEIKRDYDFLIKLWDEIRERTLSSRAPALIYEEANLIKRTIRDIYTRDIEEVLVEGEEAYRIAKDFMRALMPSHARRVQLYKDKTAHLFSQQQVESQIEALHSPTVRLKSGGSIVINTTEALVAIDVNSGRSTRERNIEETALKTNLEAAVEIARQLRLRDLAGLIVIDFIDMEDRRNNSAVERKLKEALKADRARLQLGRISPFGLFEMSRQRLRPSLFETSMQTCPVCHGHGHVRSVESTALHVLRAIEEEAARGRSAEVAVYVPIDVALYMLNQKRDALYVIEKEQGLRAVIERDDSLVSPVYRIEQRREQQPEADANGEEEAFELPVRPTVEAAPAEANGSSEAATDDEEKPRRRRRGRRGGRRRGRRPDEEQTLENAALSDSDEHGADDHAADDHTLDDHNGDDHAPHAAPAEFTESRSEEPDRGEADLAASGLEPTTGPVEAQSDDRVPEEPVPESEAAGLDAEAPQDAEAASSAAAAEAVEEKPKRRPRRRKTAKAVTETTEEGSAESAAAEAAASATPEQEQQAGEAPPKPARRRRPRKPAKAAPEPTDVGADNASAAEAVPAEVVPAEVAETEAFVSDTPEDRGIPQERELPTSGSSEPADGGEDSESVEREEPRAAEAAEAASEEPALAAAHADGDAPSPASTNSGPYAPAETTEAQPSVQRQPEEDRPRRRGWWQRLLE